MVCAFAEKAAKTEFSLNYLEMFCLLTPYFLFTVLGSSDRFRSAVHFAKKYKHGTIAQATYTRKKYKCILTAAQVFDLRKCTNSVIMWLQSN